MFNCIVIFLCAVKSLKNVRASASTIISRTTCISTRFPTIFSLYWISILSPRLFESRDGHVHEWRSVIAFN